MAKPKTLTDRMVAKLKPGPKRLTMPDPLMRGHYVRVTPMGAKSFVAVARDPDGKQVWATLGSADVLAIAEAREQARECIKRIKSGQPAFEPPPPKSDSFKDIAETYMKRHVRAKGLRTEREIRRILRKYIYPVLQERDFESIRRSDVTALLDMVEDGSGPRQADTVLTVLRSIMNFHAKRVDDYIPPIIPGMRRDDPKARERILDDDEIRAVWAAADDNSTYGAFMRLALLTAQRREKLASLKWADVTIDGTWNIPTEDREKGNGGTLVLPEMAQAIIRARPRVNAYVFAGRDGPFTSFAHGKRALDAKVAKRLGEPLPPWTLHDLRRSARSLLARAGVSTEIAERIMGHARPSIEATYNLHSHEQEKAAALERLAGLLDTIINPPGENVVALREAVE
ncbi:MAG: integrase family protein [Kiloniellales bacterium]